MGKGGLVLVGVAYAANKKKRKKKSTGGSSCDSIWVTTKKTLNNFNKSLSSNKKFADVCKEFNVVYADLEKLIYKTSEKGKTRKAINSLKCVKECLDDIVKTPSENSMKKFGSEVDKSKSLWLSLPFIASGFIIKKDISLILDKMYDAVKNFINL